MAFNENLKELRSAHGLSQKDVASMLGVDRTTYTKYETGDNQPDIKTVKKIADFFNVSVDYMLGRDEKKNDIPTDVTLSEKDLKKIKKESNRLRGLIMASLGVTFDDEMEDEEILEKVMKTLDEGMMLAIKEAREKYTPKKCKNKNI